MPRIGMERSGEMEVFARVVAEGGFSAAARGLEMSPSAVSKLISRLEARLGARLLTRTTRALRLTDEGEAYHRATLRILAEMEAADQAASRGAARGRLRVNASVGFGNLVLTPLIPEFLRRHPEITLDLSFTDDVVDLLEKRADVAIRMGSLPDSALVARKLGETGRVVCAAPEYLARRGVPERPGDLRAHECLGFTFRPSGVGWPFVVEGLAVEQPVAGGPRVNNGETMRQLALGGAGIARVGRFHVAGDLAAGRLVAVLEAFNPGDREAISAVHLGGGPVLRRVRVFVEYLVERLGVEPLLAVDV